MSPLFKRNAFWLAVWALLVLAGSVGLARNVLIAQRELFDTHARIAHRLLSQRVVQHDAVLATLALLALSDGVDRSEQRLPSVYPQILSVQRREGNTPWPDAPLQALDQESRRLGRAVLASTDLARGRYRILLGAQPSSYLLDVDIRTMVPWSEWPMVPATSPTRLSLEYAGQALVLQSGTSESAQGWGWDFSALKVLAAESQPLQMRAQRHVGWSELPWGWCAVWAALAAMLVKASAVLVRQRDDRHRAQELLRLGQVARLNTLGELAAGMAHELNQPLTAILANTQAATRLLAEADPDLTPVRLAMSHAVAQARRASEVVGRLRRVVEQPDLGDALQTVTLQEVTRKALYLLEPEFQHRALEPVLHAPPYPLLVLAEPVALEQILHNLLSNALQALDQAQPSAPSLTVTLSATATSACLAVQDNGHGIAADVLPRIFEPFFTTRAGGLGLGLSLCQTLANGMGGTLVARNLTPCGAELALSLPLVTPSATAP